MKCEVIDCTNEATQDLKLRHIHIMYMCNDHAKKWEHEKQKDLKECAKRERKLNKQDAI